MKALSNLCLHVVLEGVGVVREGEGGGLWLYIV